jgi:hypothetical protein
MKIAFLFDKVCPTYDLTFRVIKTIPEVERQAMDSLISAGFWELNDCATGLGLRRADEFETFVARLIRNQKESITRIISDESIVELIRGDIFAVIIHSIGRSLALQLHESLGSSERYRGMIQILPQLAIHRKLFGSCPPIMRLEKKSLFVWYSDGSDPGDGESEESRTANEMCKWARDEYPLLGLDVQKKSVGFKGSLVDRDSDNAFVVQKVADELVERWAEITEHVIFKLDDFAPDVAAELNLALKGIRKSKITEAECGQVAVSLRRSLELLADVLVSGNPDRLAEARLNRRPQGDKYKDLIWNYIAKHFAHNQHLKDDVWFQFEHLTRLLNKGVHEHWIMDMIRPLSIRTVLVMNSLLFPVKAGVVQMRVGDDLF